MIKALRFGEKLAALSALALLGFLFLDWFGANGLEGAYFNSANPSQVAVTSEYQVRASGWHALGWLALALCMLAILAGLVLPFVVALYESPVLPVLTAVLTVLLGGAAVIGLLVQVVFQPGNDKSVAVLSGWWLGLIAAFGIARGGFLSMRDEYLPGVPIADVEVRPAPPAVPAA